MKAIGYLVVRRPECNFDGYSIHTSLPPSLNGTNYAGIDRMGWFDLYDANSRDEPSARRMLAALNRARDAFGKHPELGFALTVLREYHPELNEVIAIQPEPLTAINDPSLALAEISEFLGFEPTLANRTVLTEGLYPRPHLFEKWVPSINTHGLFSDIATAKEYAEEYKRLAILDIMEPFGQDESSQIDVLGIWRMSQLDE